MKKNYIAPSTETFVLETEKSLLVLSVTEQEMNQEEMLGRNLDELLD